MEIEEFAHALNHEDVINATVQLDLAADKCYTKKKRKYKQTGLKRGELFQLSFISFDASVLACCYQ